MSSQSFVRGKANLYGMLILFSVMLAIAAAGSASQASGSERIIAPAATAHRTTQIYMWSLPQVRELIALIKESERRGLNSGDYGLAALNSELEQCEQLWGTAGSRQLDTLARTSALSLAADYQRLSMARNKDVFGHAPSPQAQAEQLGQALKANRLRIWMTAQAPATPPKNRTF